MRTNGREGGVPASMRNNCRWAFSRASMLATAAIWLFVSACAPSVSQSTPGPLSVDVKMSEYRFEYRTSEIRKGRAVFRVVNTGKLDHDLVVLVLPADLPPLLEQLRSDERRIVSRLASVPVRNPGERGTFAVNLEPGRYGLVCSVVDPDGGPHGPKGMVSEFAIK